MLALVDRYSMALTNPTSNPSGTALWFLSCAGHGAEMRTLSDVGSVGMGTRFSSAFKRWTTHTHSMH